MFFTRVKIIVTFFTALILGTLGWPETGNASDQKILVNEESVRIDSFSSYYRSFTVVSNFYPSVPKNQTIIAPQMVWPTDTKVIASGYGHRNPSCSVCSSNHKGVDFTPGKGEPVYASLDGIISQIEHRGGFGLHVYIDHIIVVNNETQYWRTVYAHLQKDSVPANLAVGQIIEAGTVVGAVGNTGTSTGSHLHFEIIVNGQNVDPAKYLVMYANQ
jgi:murein DD-endopeptidase MepM/ murein hydrolase activator NlpD